MPELPEVEAYRRLAELALQRRIVSVATPDPWYVKGVDGAAVHEALVGRRFVAARRTGKLLVLDTSDDGPSLGLRFGMTGRLLVDGAAGVEGLLYTSGRDVPAWDRFGLGFADGGHMIVRDPRRLGGITLDPEESALGPDVLGLTLGQLRAALDSSAPLKARLMDQARLAGVGNLLADEALWRAGLVPTRPARSLTAAERRRLHRHLLATVRGLIDRGGSHTGDLMAARAPGGRCPRDGTPLVRARVGGRTSWWCPVHQR